MSQMLSTCLLCCQSPEHQITPFLPLRLSYSIPIMVASMFAKWTGDRLYKGSLYDVQIRLNNYPYLQFDKASNKMADSFASDIMHPR